VGREEGRSRGGWKDAERERGGQELPLGAFSRRDQRGYPRCEPRDTNAGVREKGVRNAGKREGRRERTYPAVRTCMRACIRARDKDGTRVAISVWGI